MTRSGNHAARRSGRAAASCGHAELGRRCCAQAGDRAGHPSGPSAAERARTLVAGPASAVLAVPGLPVGDPLSMLPERRTVTGDGDLILRLPAASPVLRAVRHAADDELAAILELTDIAPVAVANRIRGRALVAGWLTPLRGAAEPGWLRLEVGEVSVEDVWGTEPVEPDDFAAAEPDLLAECEAELLQHLAVAHAEHLRWLSALIRRPGTTAAEPASEVIPLALDRFGLRIRLEGSAGGSGNGGGASGRRPSDRGGLDAYFPFPAPAADMSELRRALHGLFEEAGRAAG